MHKYCRCDSRSEELAVKCTVGFQQSALGAVGGGHCGPHSLHSVPPCGHQGFLRSTLSIAGLGLSVLAEDCKGQRRARTQGQFCVDRRGGSRAGRERGEMGWGGLSSRQATHRPTRKRPLCAAQLLLVEGPRGDPRVPGVLPRTWHVGCLAASLGPVVRLQQSQDSCPRWQSLLTNSALAREKSFVESCGRACSLRGAGVELGGLRALCAHCVHACPCLLTDEAGPQPTWSPQQALPGAASHHPPQPAPGPSPPCGALTTVPAARLSFPRTEGTVPHPPLWSG